MVPAPSPRSTGNRSCGADPSGPGEGPPDGQEALAALLAQKDEECASFQQPMDAYDDLDEVDDESGGASTGGGGGGNVDEIDYADDEDDEKDEV